ncbi:MAG TPA: hypothetical protein VM425_08685 [Myxococcota bacterium]|nr:hypothetical protein [Myxococcota bacterium]
MKRNSTTIMTVLVFTAALFFPVFSQAESFSLTGGQITPAGHKAVRVGVGFPGIYGAYHIPLSEKFELAPRFSFFYGSDTHAPVVGNGLGVELKFSLMSGDKFNLALLFEPEFLLAYHPGTAVVFRVGGPGVLMSYAMQENFQLIAGMKIPFGFVIHPSFVASIPILFVLGFEFNVSNNLNVFLNAQMGPDILAASGGSTTQFSPNVFLGISMLL